MTAQDYSPLQRYVHIRMHHKKYLRWDNPCPRLLWECETPGWLRQVWDLYHYATTLHAKGVQWDGR
jgi:hypothetical protein